MSSRALLRCGLLLALACLSSFARAEQSCAPGKVGLVVRDELVPWPFDLPQGTGLTINVLSNDLDDRGGTLTVSSPLLSHPIGTVSVTADQRALRFVPTTPQTYPGDGRTISYTVITSTGATATARAILVRDPSQTASTFTATCQGRDCTFKAVPQRAGARSYNWRFDGNPACNRVEWRGVAIGCVFPVPAGGAASQTAPVTLEINYYSGDRDQVLGQVTWQRLDPVFTWDWWSAHPGGGGTDGLSVAAWIHACPTCQQLCPGPIDELYWDWGEAGANRVPVYPVCGSGGHLGYPEKTNHTYRAPGTYTVRALLRVGGAGPDVPYPPQGMTVEVRNNPPTVQLSRLSSASDEVRLQAEVRDDAVDPLAPDPTRGPSLVSWDFGDESAEKSLGPFQLTGGGTTLVRTHRYAKAGKYVATVQATDVDGAVGVAQSQEIVVDNVRPVASFGFFCNGLTCKFDASATKDDDPVAYYGWTFEAGGATEWSSAPGTGHTFTTSGVKRVTLLAQDGRGLQSDPVTREVTVTGEAPRPLAYYSRPVPCRATDTRWPGATRWRSGQVNMLLSYNPNDCYLPAGARAVAATVTVISPGGPGYLSVYSRTFDDNSLPATAALVFDPATSPRSAHVTVEGAFPWGVVSVFPPRGGIADAHVTVDVDGFYADPADVAIPGLCLASPWCGPLDFQALGQQRLLDTRQAPPILSPGVARYERLAGSGDVGGRLSPRAVWLNATVVPEGAGTLTLFDATASAQQAAQVAHMIFAPGRLQTSSILAPLGAGRGADLGMLASYGATHLGLDGAGLFAPRETSPEPLLRFRALQPCRAFDSRAPERGGTGNVVTPDAPLVVQVTGNCGVPATATAIVANVTAVSPTGEGYLRAYAADALPPPGVALTFQAGANVGNTTVLPLSADGKSVLAPFVAGSDVDRGLHVAIDVYGYFAP